MNAARVNLPKAKLSTLPTALAAYRSNIERITDEIRAYGAEPILVAQVVQSVFGSQEERERLWMGEILDGQGFVSEEQYPLLLAEYNKTLRAVSIESNINFIDLPNLIAHDASLFYDGMHFNEHGAKQVAVVVSDYFLNNIIPRQDGIVCSENAVERIGVNPFD